MRKLSNLLMAVLLAVGFAAPASSATLSATGSLGVSLGALPPITILGGPVAIAVSTGTGSYVLPASVFQSSVILAPQLFTGVSLISSLNVAATNLTITQAGGAGSGVIAGSAVIGVLGGLINLAVPLNVGGGGAPVTGLGAAALAITVTNGLGWTTGTVSVTGVTTTTANGAVINTAFAVGSDTRTAGHAGMITLVTPTRVLTNAAGNLPLFGILKLTFSAPEPGTLLLLGSGIVGLAVLGRRRMRK